MEVGSETWKRTVRDSAGALGIAVGPGHADQFAAHARELLLWNRTLNLTAITDPVGVAVKHFLDSIAPAAALPRSGTLLDVGSGGGFPGIPLKILIPSLTVLLIDASRKKVSFLKHAIRTLALEGIDAAHVRAEDLPGEHGPSVRLKSTTAGEFPVGHRRFDVVISRAVTSLDHFVALALPVLAEHGTIMAMKARIESRELSSAASRARSLLGVPTGDPDPFVMQVRRYLLPVLESERSLVSIRLKYPAPPL
jgi:16S rRNA (guanine527-N7)-methyltransferase